MPTAQSSNCERGRRDGHPKDAGANGGCYKITVGKSSRFLIFLVASAGSCKTPRDETSTSELTRSLCKVSAVVRVTYCATCNEARYSSRSVYHNSTGKVFRAVFGEPATTPHLKEA